MKAIFFYMSFLTFLFIVLSAEYIVETAPLLFAILLICDIVMILWVRVFCTYEDIKRYCFYDLFERIVRGK